MPYVREWYEELDRAVDQFENGFHHPLFRDTQKQEGATLETVVKIQRSDDGLLPHAVAPEGDLPVTSETKTTLRFGKTAAWKNVLSNDLTLRPTEGSASRRTRRQAKGIVELIDAHDDRYVLAKPQDPSKYIEDKALQLSLIYLVVVGYIFAALCDLVRIPSLFGYIAAGILLGPAVLDVIDVLFFFGLSFPSGWCLKQGRQHNIQVETFSQFGMAFIIFVLGIDFSITRLKMIWRVAMGAGLICLMLTVSFGLLLGSFTQLPMQEIALVGFIFSLSSTAVVIKCLTKRDLEADYGQIILAILVLQDFVLSCLLSVIPLLGETDLRFILPQLGQIIVHLVVLVALMTATYFIPKSLVSACWRRLQRDVRTVALIAWCLLWMLVYFLCVHLLPRMTQRDQIGEYIHLSSEIGCFAAGLLLSAISDGQKEEVLEKVIPIRDFFTCLFFGAVGLHIFPSFFFKIAPLLILVSIFVMLVKLLFFYLPLRYLYRLKKRSSLLVGAALCQTSEFAFVLASRGKSLGILSRDTYYLVIGTSSVTLLLTPVIWQWALLLHQYAHQTKPTR